MKNFHSYHIVDQSPWPILASFSFLMLMFGMINFFHFSSYFILLIGMLLLMIIAWNWWRDTIRESTYQGNHTNNVMTGLKLGMLFFIISEVLFFFSFFWMLFHSMMSPTMEIGSMWPPKSIIPFNPTEIPLLNTTILLASGVSITWCHYSILSKNQYNSWFTMNITIGLGIIFTTMQIFEYLSSPFSMADSIYGSSFFMMTGFHGLHVLIGTIFLIITNIRIMQFHFSSTHHIGFEMSAWYWHFVDVVWLFLFSSIYWWGS